MDPRPGTHKVMGVTQKNNWPTDSHDVPNIDPNTLVHVSVVKISSQLVVPPSTTGIWLFAECHILC
jgi:hypothetical protein